MLWQVCRIRFQVRSCMLRYFGLVELLRSWCPSGLHLSSQCHCHYSFLNSHCGTSMPDIKYSLNLPARKNLSLERCAGFYGDY